MIGYRLRIKQSIKREFKCFYSLPLLIDQWEIKLFCPCKKCNNYIVKSRDDVEVDLFTIDIGPTYTRWFRHGKKRHDLICEESDSNDESDGCVSR